MGLAGWPTVTDDPGDKQTGTIINKALTDAIKASIENDVTPTGTAAAVKAKETIQEVFDARGSLGTLDQRLDVALNENGTLKTQASLATVSQVLGGLGAVNLAGNYDFQIWPVSDAFAPAYYVLGGAGAAVARVGTGLGDTNRKIGDFAAKVTAGAGAPATLRQIFLSAAGMTRSGLTGINPHMVVGAWVKTSAPNSVRMIASDGVTTVSSGFHNGDGNWQFLPIPDGLTVGGTANILWAQLEVAASQVAYISGLTCLLLPYAADLTQFVPGTPVYQSGQFNWLGNVATGTDLRHLRNPYPFIVKNVALRAKTAPATTAIIVDVNHWDGSAFQTMFSTRPQIAAAANFGNAAPDGTYSWRCFWGYRTSGADISNTLLSLDVDQIGTGTVGADMTAEIHHMFYTRPLDIFNDLVDLGI